MPDGGDLTIDGLSDLRLIGSGGFSAVYAAWEEGFQRWVAVKVLHNLDEAGRRRFDRERGIMGQLSDHPNVITPFRFGYTSTGAPFLVMAYVEGGSLEALLLERGSIPAAEAIGYLAPICDALSYGHQKGILHRDIKPGNVLLSRAGAKLTDYGISAIREATATQAAFTLAHTPPETFAQGNDARDERSDLYSLASSLYQVVAGRSPFEVEGTDSQAGYMYRILELSVPPIASYEGSPLHDFLLRSLDKNPDRRPQTAADFGVALYEIRLGLGVGQATPTAATSTSPPIAEVVDQQPIETAETRRAQLAEVARQAELARRAEQARRGGETSAEPMPAAPPTAIGSDPTAPVVSGPVVSGPRVSGPGPVVSGPGPAVVVGAGPARAKTGVGVLLPGWVKSGGRARFLLLTVALLVAVVGVGATIAILGDDDGDTPAAGGEQGEDASNESDGSPADDPAPVVAPVLTRGGVLAYGVEGDVDGSWAPYRLDCLSSCAMVLGAISDPILDIAESGEVVPVLATGIDSNDEGTVWTVDLREGVLFHDGTPLDAAAVKYNFDVCRASPVRGFDFLRIGDITTDGEFTVVFELTEPWGGFPAAVLDAPCGAHMMSPAWLMTLESNPLREESIFTGVDLIDQPTVDTPSTGSETRPVSMGPFRFTSYVAGDGGGMSVERNDGYWRGEGPPSLTDEGLPYLDGIEFKVIDDVKLRSADLRAASVDIIHTDHSVEIAGFHGDERFATLEDNHYADTNFYLVNLASGPLDQDGLNEASPLLDQRVRRALAHTMDRERLSQERGAGLLGVAAGPFSPGQPGYLDDNGYPDYDVEAGQALLADYIGDPNRSDRQAVGEPISFSFDTTDDPFNVETNQLIVAIWKEALGSDVDVTINPIPQRMYVQRAIDGDFEVLAWQQHGGHDHGEQLRFWEGDQAVPLGSGSANFGRIQDPDLDELIAQVRLTVDPDQRRALFEDINRIFGERVYYLPTHWTTWAIIADSHVHGFEAGLLPDGSLAFPLIDGVHPTAQLWCTDGACD